MVPNKTEHFLKFYMAVAVAAAQLSYAKKRKVGAVIVKGRNIVAYGFNGTVNGEENVCEEKVVETKDLDNMAYEKLVTLPNVVHAEVNAVIKAGKECEGAHMYLTLFPCNDCMKLMAQAGIKKFFYLEENNKGNTETYGMYSIKLTLDTDAEKI